MNHLRITLSIALKDLRDAFRDGRVLMPLLMELFFPFVIDLYE